MKKTRLLLTVFFVLITYAVFAQSDQRDERYTSFTPITPLVGSKESHDKAPEGLYLGTIVLGSKNCVEYHIASGVPWIETKCEWELKCVNTPFGQVCTNIWGCKFINCHVDFYAHICIGAKINVDSCSSDIEKCIGEAIKESVPTFLCCGFNAGRAKFIETFGKCINPDLQVSVNIYNIRRCN